MDSVGPKIISACTARREEIESSRSKKEGLERRMKGKKTATKSKLCNKRGNSDE